MSNTPALTDERLRTRLDTDQLKRERLCLALMGIDGRFKNVRPRQPKGGPDGGRDLEAQQEDGRDVWGCIGFRNSANDSTADRTWAATKFKNDLATAIKAKPDLAGFIFYTNVQLTAAKRDSLCDQAHKAGISLCDIIDRERMRILLDGVDGLSIRFQYLGVPLSEAEQAAFFSRWGVRIEDVIASLESRLDRRLKRIEFMLETRKAVQDLRVYISLNPQFPLTKGEHFRACAMLLLGGLHTRHMEIGMAACDEQAIRRTKLSEGWKNCISTTSWMQLDRWRQGQNETRFGEGAQAWDEPIGVLSLHRIQSRLIPDESTPRLDDFDNAGCVFFVNRSLADRIERIRVTANEYVLCDIPRSELYIETTQVVAPPLPWAFSESELEDGWHRLLVTAFSTAFRFSEATPKRFFQADEKERD